MAASSSFNSFMFLICALMDVLGFISILKYCFLSISLFTSVSRSKRSCRVIHATVSTSHDVIRYTRDELNKIMIVENPLAPLVELCFLLGHCVLAYNLGPIYNLPQVLRQQKMLCLEFPCQPVVSIDHLPMSAILLSICKTQPHNLAL